ncbi:MAG: aldehyde dehydrogenase family protein [Syntrophaceae bacterium]
MHVESESVQASIRPSRSTKDQSPSPNTLSVNNPATGAVIGEVPSLNVAEAMDALVRVHEAQKVWGALPIRKRAAIISRFAEILYRRMDEVAALLSAETGKPLYEAKLCEVLPVIRMAGYYARHAEKQLKQKRISIGYFKNFASYLHYKPRGVVFIISPWNFPFTIPGGAVICSLLAGNSVLLKPASLTPLIAYKMRELLLEAGVDEHVFEVISGPGRMASELIESGHNLIGYVNFTGSTEVGKTVAQLCGKHLLPNSMELGGKDPAIVCADADLDKTVRAITFGAFCNSGQICASIERVYVHRDVYEPFVQKMEKSVRALRQGDPAKGGYALDMGCMTSEEQLQIVERQVADARAKGARIVTGGKRVHPESMFYEPTMILDATDDMDAVAEETFGPLLPIMRVESDEEAIGRSNTTMYGLSAYVYSRSQARARRMAEQLDAGTVMINDALVTHALPEVPWQGVKQSGIGRIHTDDALRDLSIGYHVFYDIIPLPRPIWPLWTWPPYSAFKIAMFKRVFGFIGLNSGIKKKIQLLLH